MPHPQSPIDVQEPNLGPIGGLINSILGDTRSQASARTAATAQATTGAFMQRVLEHMGPDRDPQRFGAALFEELRTPEGQQALSQPDFLEQIKKLGAIIGGEQEAVPPSSVAFNRSTGEFGAQAPGPRPTLTTAQKNAQAIVNAKTPEERAILVAQLPRNPSGELGVDDYIMAIAAGGKVDPKARPRALVEDMTQDQARIALALGTASGPRAPNQIDLLVGSLGGKTGTALDTQPRHVLRGGALMQESLRKSESQGTLDAILAANPATQGLVGQGKGSQNLEEIFRKFDEGTLFDEQPAAAGGTAEVPLAGGKGGQASGPTATVTSPAQITKFNAVKPEEFAELSPETLTQIALALNSGQLQLSPEQKAALLVALNAEEAKRSGAAQ